MYMCGFRSRRTLLVSLNPQQDGSCDRAEKVAQNTIVTGRGEDEIRIPDNRKRNNKEKEDIGPQRNAA